MNLKQYRNKIKIYNMYNTGFYNIVNPLTPYMIADFYISDEIYDNTVWKDKFDKSLIKGNNLIETMEYDKINDYDIVQCQICLLNYFLLDVLPFIKRKIILLTSQYDYPGLEDNDISQKILNHPNIFLWVSQNHIYKHRKCMSFPFGIHQDKVNFYYKFMNNNKVKKNYEISKTKLTIQDVLPDEHIRIIYPLLGIESGEYLYYYDFLNSLLENKFVVSPEGDRHDCFRHYEAIGLGCVPICNVDLSDIFGDSMIYSDGKEMSYFVEFERVNKRWSRPNKKIIFREFWEQKIRDRIKKME